MFDFKYYKTLIRFGVLLSIGGCSSDIEKPQLFSATGNVATFPVDAGKDNIDTNGSIVIQFNKEILPSSINNNSVEVNDLNGFVDGTVELAITGKHLIFMPSDIFSILTKYTVTVLSTVVGLDKQSFNAGPYTFITRDGSWTKSEVKLVAAQGKSITDIQAEIDNAGNIIVTWLDFDTKAIWSNRFDNTATIPAWRQPEKLQSTALPASNLMLDMDGAGNAFLIWVELDDTAGTKKLWTNRFDSTNDPLTWSGAAEVSAALQQKIIPPPKIAFNRVGSGLMVWFKYVNARYEIWAKRYNEVTKSWESAISIGDSCFPTTDPTYLDVKIDEQGIGMAAWSGETSVCVSRYQGDTTVPTWTATSFSIVNARYLYNYHVSTQGNIYAIWSDNTNLTTCIYSCFKFEYGAFGSDGSAFRTSSDSYSGKLYELVLNSLGVGYILVRLDFLSGQPGWYSNISYLPFTGQLSSREIGNEVLLIAGASQLDLERVSHTYPKLTLDARDNGMLTWVRYSTKHDIMVKRLNATGNTTTWAAPLSIHTIYGVANIDGPKNPVVHFNSKGQGVAVWFDDRNIYANRFE